MTQTWPDSSLALLWSPSSPHELSLATAVTHSRSRRTRCSRCRRRCRPSIVGAFGRCTAVVPFCSRCSHAFTGGRIFVWLRGIRSVYAIPGTDMDEISKSEDKGRFAVCS
ncbi:hypothetical protein JG688_00011827 [Phytophthora aleatoria]|uniref:Uncharacterized protein n=1 Tax=Phytophthora aleatoria TaxID=2496075 RepID=A0A8J5J008_9STRA|nr:hypothetical protein JG688_00011827 [Phytophthora aleatoria]